MTVPTVPSGPTAPIAPSARIRKGWDIALTVVFLVLDLGFLIVASLVELFSFAFFDVCPNSNCAAVGDASSAIFTAAIVMAVILAVALILSIALLVTKRRAWWVPLAAGVAMVIVDVVFIGMAASIIQNA